MCLILGLIVNLIIFQGIMMQSESNTYPTPPDWTKDLKIDINIHEFQPFSSRHFVKMFFNDANFTEIKNTEKIEISDDVASKELSKNPILLMAPDGLYNNTFEYYENNDLFLVIGNYTRLTSFLKKFAVKLKRIAIIYNGKCNAAINTIQKYMKKLDEVRIATSSYLNIWNALSDKKNKDIFRKVKKFQYFGKIGRAASKLEKIFPNIESIKLIAEVVDKKCFASVYTLKELDFGLSVKEDELVPILETNKNIKKITLTSPSKLNTVAWIAINLQKLNTLNLIFPHENVLFAKKNERKYILPSVENFSIIFDDIQDILGDYIFNMPSLKKLRLSGRVFDEKFDDLIKHFNKLKIVEIITRKTDQEYIEKIRKNFEAMSWNLLHKEMIRYAEHYLAFECGARH